MKRLRISAISYLNTAPLMWDFEHGEAARNFEISYTVPSQCAAALEAGTADIGIIPAAAYASIPRLVILPDVAIASRQPVRSILLVSKVPLEQIRSVALDNSSLTSVALTKVLFAKWWGGQATFYSMQPELEKMLTSHHAGLLIGDPALKVDRSRWFTYDLAEEWIRLTGRPFVFAFWAVRAAALENVPPFPDLSSVFQQSRDHGLVTENVNQIAREWAHRVGLTRDGVKQYLLENIYYRLDEDCIDGLRLFYELTEQFGILRRAPALSFLEAAKPMAQ